MKADQLTKYVIQPVLKYLGLYSPEAETLLLLTAAQESHVGEYIHQTGGGPAKGIFEMEDVTYDDMWSRVLPRHPVLETRVKNLAGPWAGISRPHSDEMNGNLNFACAMCRIKYLSIPRPIPTLLYDIAGYYKEFYNTPLGAATVDEALKNYHRYVR